MTVAVSLEKPLIVARRPRGVRAGTRLGRLIRGMDNVAVAYCVPAGTDGNRRLAGWGRLHVEVADGFLRCRVAGEVQRPSPFEFVLHSFWVTRRGMIVVAANLLEERAPQSRPESETFIQPVPPFDRRLKIEANKWLRKI